MAVAVEISSSTFKEKIKLFLENRFIEQFLIGLILLNLVVFIFQTDTVFYDNYKKYIDIFETISISIFTFEYFLRVLTLEKFKDILKPLMLIDLFSILPYYLAFVSVNTIFLRVARLFRLLRIAKLTRYTEAFNNIKNAFANKKNELLVTGAFFILALTLASIFIYYAEHSTGNPAFKSIPSSFWWSVVTFTSVGYGDTYPMTTMGKMIGSITAIAGVGLHGLLVGIIGAAFIDAISFSKRSNKEES